MRVILICHSETEALRRSAFAGDEPLTPAGIAEAASVTAPRADRAVRGPSAACRQTAAGLGVAAVPDERLRGCDYGRWRGQTLDQTLAAEPAAVRAWLADPAAAPHGGESLAALGARVGGWLDDQGGTVRALLAVADATVIRAAVVHAIEAGPRSLWRIDVSALSRTVLVGEPGRWSLRELGR
ncbi:MAG: histidine phosphatase family protein [Pseudonocardia sp.]